MLHGEAGEDGALREVLALLGVPFVGSIGSACRVAFDKSIATTVVAEAGIATPTQVALPHEIFRELGAQALVAALADQIGFPMMVKPSRGGSALGASKVSRPEELPSAMVGAYAYGPGGGDRAVHRGHRGDCHRGRSGRRSGRPAGGGDPTRVGGVRLRARYTAGATRFLCPAEIERVAGGGVRRPGPHACTTCWVCGTCRGPI